MRLSRSGSAAVSFKPYGKGCETLPQQIGCFVRFATSSVSAPMAHCHLPQRHCVPGEGKGVVPLRQVLPNGEATTLLPSPDAERRWGGGTAPEGRGGRGRAAEPLRFSGSQLQTLRKRMRSLAATDRLFCGLRGLFRQCADGALPPFLACRLGRRFCLRQRSPPATRAPTRLRRWGRQGSCTPQAGVTQRRGDHALALPRRGASLGRGDRARRAWWERSCG